MLADPFSMDVRRIMKTADALAAFGSKPFGNYESIDDCVAKNPDKDNPPGYCATIMRAIEGKETDWVDVKPWKGWTFEMFIGDEDVVDKQKERVRDIDYVMNLPFLVKYGYFEWVHTGQKIGEPVAWRYAMNPKTKNVGPQIRVGLIDPNDPSVPEIMKGELRGAREAIENWATSGQTSIKGMWGKRKECDDKTCYLVTDHMVLWAVGWVANRAANPAANVTNVTGQASKSVDEKQPRDPAAVCGQLWFHGTESQREAFGGGTEGRGPDERPPGAWWDDCLGHVEKSSEKDLAAFVKGLPGHVRLKAAGMIAAGCAPCVALYDGMIRAGFRPEQAEAAVQEKLDAVTGWTGRLKTPPAATRTGKSMPDAAETPPAGNAGDAAGIAGIAEKQPVDYIGMAALQEIAKRVEALELGQQSTTPKMVEEAVRPVKETLAKIAGDDLKTLRSAMVKIDTRLSALEGFAGRASLGLASKAFVAPPRDTGPKQGATTKRVLEVAAGAKSFSEFNERMRKLAKGPGGE